jgi:hypothetical protein
MNYPSRWSDYTQTSKALGLEISEALSAWASRFRAARSLKAMVFEQLSEASQRAYFVAQKLTLADTAIEAFEQAVALDVGTIGIFDPDLAFELWDVRQSELKSLMSTIENRKLRLAYEAFRDLDKDKVQDADLRFVVRAFRHANSHGIFNPAKTELYRAKNYSQTLLSLAEAGLSACEAQFTRLVDDGTLSGDLAVEHRAQHFRDLTHVSSVYVGAIQSIDVTESGLLIKRLHSPAWQVIDFETLKLGEISFDERDMPKPSVVVLNEDEIDPHLEFLDNIDNSSFVAWQLPDSNWFAGNKDKFLLYDPTENRVMKRFSLPQDLRPYFLNDPKLGMTADSTGALVPMWDKTLYFDFEAGMTKVINTDLWSGAVYAGKIDAFVSKDGTSLNLSFYSSKEIAVQSETQGEIRVGDLLGADQIVDFPNSTTCLVLKDHYPSRLLSVILESGEDSELAKVGSVLAIDGNRLLAIEGDELVLLHQDGKEPKVISRAKGDLCHFSAARQEATLVDRWTNKWTKVNTETLVSKQVVQSKFESLQQVMVLQNDSNLFLGVIGEELILSRVQKGKSHFTLSLTDLNANRTVLLLSPDESQALIWSQFHPVLYLIDVQTGEQIKRFDFDSGVLDIVWPENTVSDKPFITLFGSFGVQKLDLASGVCTLAFSLPNPGLSMRICGDLKSMLVLTTLQSDMEYSTSSAGWLVQCSLT